MAFSFSGGKDNSDISELRRNVDKLMKEGNIKKVVGNIQSTVLDAGSTNKINDIKWALGITEDIVGHIRDGFGKLNHGLPNNGNDKVLSLLWDLPSLKGAWGLYHKGLKGDSEIDASIVGQFNTHVREKGTLLPDIKERLGVSSKALNVIAGCAEEIGEVAIKSESSLFTAEMMFGVVMDCMDLLDYPKRFANAEMRFAEVEKNCANALERDGQPYAAERARRIAQKEENMARLILSRNIIETREEHNEKVHGKLVEIVPIGVWLAVERVAERMDIDNKGHYDLRATQLFAPGWGTSTVNIWVSKEDKPKDWPASAEKPGPKHTHAFLATATAIRMPGSDDVVVHIKIHNTVRKEITELRALKEDGHDFSMDKSFRMQDIVNAAENGTEEDWRWTTNKLKELMQAGRDTMVEGDLHGLRCPACKHDVQEFSTTDGLEGHFRSKHGVETYGTATISGKIVVFTNIGAVLVYDGTGR